MTDAVVRSEAGVLRWEGSTARTTLAGTTRGTLVLTERHLIFLATAGDGLGRPVRSVTAGALGTLTAPGTAGGTAGGGAGGDRGLGGFDGFDGFDLGALGRPGSFAVPLDHVDEARAASRWDRTAYLALRIRDTDEAAHEFAVMPEAGLSDARGWARAIEVTRAAARR